MLNIRAFSVGALIGIVVCAVVFWRGTFSGLELTLWPASILPSSSNGTVEHFVVFAFAVASNAILYGIGALLLIWLFKSITSVSDVAG